MFSKHQIAGFIKGWGGVSTSDPANMKVLNYFAPEATHISWIASKERIAPLQERLAQQFPDLVMNEQQLRILNKEPEVFDLKIE